MDQPVRGRGVRIPDGGQEDRDLAADDRSESSDTRSHLHGVRQPRDEQGARVAQAEGRSDRVSLRKKNGPRNFAKLALAGESPRSAPRPDLHPSPIALREVREPESEDDSGPRQLHDRLGFLAVPPLWGFPDTPQAQAVRFPTRTHRYSESPYGISPARFPASICSAAWDRRER